MVLLVSIPGTSALWIDSSPVVWIRNCNDTDLSTGFCITNNTNGIFVYQMIHNPNKGTSVHDVSENYARFLCFPFRLLCI